MQSFEAACEEGDRAFKRLKPSQSSLPQLQLQRSPCSSTSQEIDGPYGKMPFDIFAKLKELHQQTNANENSTSKYNTLLLEKLVAKERLNTLIVNLYPGNKGYSLALRAASCGDSNYTDDTANMIETNQWPYEVDEFLRYIDNEQLPPFILDLLEPRFGYLFYNGCIIAEVRDYRQAYPEFKCDIHHVLLRPTLQSILADINNLIEEKPEWGNEEKDQLESQILMANEPSLCLDPDITTYQHLSEINNRKHIWSTHEFRRMAKKFSQVTVNRKRKLDQFTHKPGLEIHDSISRLRAKPKIGSAQNANVKSWKKLSEELKPVPVPSLECPQISPPSNDVVINEFKMYTRPKETSDCLPQLIEEYVLETDMPSKDKEKPRVYHIKLSILQRPSNSEYLGELYLDRDYKKNEQNGVACRFSLGSRANATRYIHQFTEIFTESGRKSARIRYGLSPGYKERVASAQAQAQQQIHVQNTNQQQNVQQVLNRGVQSQSYSVPVVNGSGFQKQLQTQVSSVPILQSHLQGPAQNKTSSQALTNQEQAINALATKLMNSAQQFQAAAIAKQQQQQQQQQQKVSGNNAAIINLLNSSPASNLNNDANTAVVNAINSTPLLSQQLQSINQKLLARKMTIPNARVLNHGNFITLNNSRLQELQQQQQTITLSSVNNANYTNFTSVPVKQQRIVSNSSSDNKSALSALLMGTPAADRPDIVGPNTNSLLLEKLGGANIQSQQTAQFIQSPKSNQQFMVQSPKSTTVLSPLSSPPPQNTNTINVQSLNLAQLQNIAGVQNLQVQLPGFAQPISLSLNVSSTNNIQGHPTSLIVSLPVTTSNQTLTTVTQAQSGTNNLGVGGQTVVLQTNAGTSNLAQLVTSNVRSTSQSIRTPSSPQAVSLIQSGQQLQLLTSVQKPRGIQQVPSPQQQQARSISRTKPITIKMAPHNSTNASQVNLPQLQQLQQICLNQPEAFAKIRRRSNNSELQ